MKKFFAFCTIFVLAVSFASTAYGLDAARAKPTKAAVTVDGKPVAFDSYNINGFNYFKLRDLAFTLRGTDKKFTVGYNNNAVWLSTGAAYVAVGGEMSAKGTVEKDAVPSGDKLILNGNPLVAEAYKIDGSNYFKLQDLGTALGFGVDWIDNTVVITTTTTTTAAAPPTTAYVPRDRGFGRIGSFSTNDLNGNAVTESVLAEKPVTFINYWATWCGPCRAELPDFPGMAEKFKDNVTFITIIDDGQNNSAAKSLADQYLKSYVNLLPVSALVAPIQSGYVPTTVIVDAGGYLLSDKIIGAVGDYSAYIEAALRLVEQDK